MKKIRELIAELEAVGFVNRGGKGSHRNFVHTLRGTRVTISGNMGEDAKKYQVKAVQDAIRDATQ
ncbi:MAG: type II toxin-antitoxin system HicA family toxin [Hyphomicrobiaceae bacterium]